jgi:hypothetical protein
MNHRYQRAIQRQSRNCRVPPPLHRLLRFNSRAPIYAGGRISAGQEIGQISPAQAHVHIEVRGYGSTTSTTGLLRPRFGAVAKDGLASPLYVVDLMAFVSSSNRGTLLQQNLSTLVPCTPQYLYSQYDNANLGYLVYNYMVRDDVSLQCFNITTGNIYAPNSCISLMPTLP